MKWNELSMADRAKYIALGVRNGVTSLDDIRDTYNSYAEGGYLDWINKVREWRPGISEDIDAEEPTYDYEGFFMEDPKRAWRMLNGDPEAHFIDKYKRPNHPTFSDESIYSTPETPGGHWHENYGGSGSWVYEPSEFTKKHLDDTKRYLENSGEGYLDGMNAVFPKRYNKFAGGGGRSSKNEYVPATLAGWLTQLFTNDNTKAAYADIGSAAVNTGADAIPVVGNAAGAIISIGDALYDAGKLIANPSWENATDLGSSLLGIVPGVGTVKDVKNISTATKQVYRNVRTTRSVRAVKKTVARKANPKSNVRVNVLDPDMKVKRSYPLQLPTNPLLRLVGTAGNWWDSAEDTSNAFNFLTRKK